MAENWRYIPGYDGKYQVSDKGRVRSVRRTITQTRQGSTFDRNIQGRVLRPASSVKNPRLYVVLGRGGSGKQVHQLVMQAFVGKPKQGEEVRHLDGNPRNNKLNNLTYGSRSENILDVFRLRRAWRILTREQADEIKSELRKGIKGSVLARRFGVSQSTVSDIKNRRTHHHDLELRH